MKPSLRTLQAPSRPLCHSKKVSSCDYGGAQQVWCGSRIVELSFVAEGLGSVNRFQVHQTLAAAVQW
jgi:hypothetical protein